MSAISIAGDTSGSITLQAPAVAGTNTVTLPAATGELSMLGGSGQTWTDVAASRALSTTYTNTTGKPITVSVSGSSTSTSTVAWTIVVDGVTLALFRINSGASGSAQSLANGFSFIVPNGSTYSVSGGGAIGFWAELR